MQPQTGGTGSSALGDSNQTVAVVAMSHALATMALGTIPVPETVLERMPATSYLAAMRMSEDMRASVLTDYALALRRDQLEHERELLRIKGAIALERLRLIRVGAAGNNASPSVWF